MVPLVQRGRVPGGENRVMDDTNKCSSGQKAEHPIDPKHVQISVQGSVSSITFERRAELGTKEAEYFHEEFGSRGSSSGTRGRFFRLDSGLYSRV